MGPIEPRGPIITRLDAAVAGDIVNDCYVFGFGAWKATGNGGIERINPLDMATEPKPKPQPKPKPGFGQGGWGAP